MNLTVRPAAPPAPSRHTAQNAVEPVAAPHASPSCQREKSLETRHLPRHPACSTYRETAAALSPFSVDKSVNSAVFPLPDNDLPPLPIRKAFSPFPFIRHTAIRPRAIPPPFPFFAGTTHLPSFAGKSGQNTFISIYLPSSTPIRRIHPEHPILFENNTCTGKRHDLLLS